MSIHALPAERIDDSAAALTHRIAEASRRDDPEDMAWRELELRVRAARLMQDETQPRRWHWQRPGRV